MILKPTPVSIDRFTYSRSEQMLVAEASDLGLGHDRDFERVWNDACDVGLTVIGHRREVVYAIHHETRDRGNDLLTWELRPAEQRDRDLPAVLIFND